VITRGKYICVEGMDGSGKTTLVDELYRRLGAAYLARFPSSGLIGGLIRSALRGEIELDQKTYLYLFCADGLQENAKIERHLEAGAPVLCDRHPTLSGRVFQVDHHTPEIVDKVYDFATVDGVLMPDHLFVLDVEPEIALTRMQARSKYKDVVFESESLERIATLRDRYQKLATRFNATVLSGAIPCQGLADVIMRMVWPR